VSTVDVYGAKSQAQYNDLEVDVSQVLDHLRLGGEVIQREFVTQCIFHQETGNPNLEINTVTGLWHCWVCGEKGNLPRLVMRVLGAGYREALELIQDYSSAPDIATIAQRNLAELEQILRPVRHKFQTIDITPYMNRRSWWWTNPIPYGTFSKHIVREYSLGFDGSHQRAIIPISVGGKWVGTIARAVRANQQPRYKYPEDFDRRHVIYGLDTVPTSSHRSIIVEGAKDCLRLRQYGYNSAVACLGTSISNEQLALLADRFDECVVFTDNDAPGHLAAFKMCSDLAECVSRVFVVQWRVASKDPNELTKSTVGKMLARRIHWSAMIEPDYDPYATRNP
jgi:DNA primase